jgi:hypothetical protein
MILAGQWFSLGTLVSSTSKTDGHDITEILLKVTLNKVQINTEEYTPEKKLSNIIQSHTCDIFSPVPFVTLTKILLRNNYCLEKINS